MRRKQHGDVRNRETRKDRDFRGQRLSQKHKEMFFSEEKSWWHLSQRMRSTNTGKDY